ncbi:MAG: hypothetical protein AAF770_02870 [Bacteroidota bacterium]
MQLIELLAVEIAQREMTVEVVNKLTQTNTQQEVANEICSHHFPGDLSLGPFSKTTLMIVLDYDTAFAGTAAANWQLMKERALPILFNLFEQKHLKSPNDLLDICMSSWFFFTTSQTPPTSNQLREKIKELIEESYHLDPITNEDTNLVKWLEQVIIRYRQFKILKNEEVPDATEVKEEIIEHTKTMTRLPPLHQPSDDRAVVTEYNLQLPLIRGYYEPRIHARVVLITPQEQTDNTPEPSPQPTPQEQTDNTPEPSPQPTISDASHTESVDSLDNDLDDNARGTDPIIKIGFWIMILGFLLVWIDSLERKKPAFNSSYAESKQ